MVAFSEREVLMMVENHIIAAQCYPDEKEFRGRLEEARRLIRNYLSGDAFCGKCGGTGWIVVDHVICLPCDGTGRTKREEETV
jgi:DnaJ-class molecular chaperone